MEAVNLGRHGLKVSRICIGTMVFGTECDEATSRAILDTADELGCEFIDTSNSYPVPPSLESRGHTEEIVGRWIKGKRNHFVLATKFANQMGRSDNESGASRKHMIEACEASLRRLQTDRIDVYYIHHWHESSPITETMEAFDRLRSDGKILYVGISNFSTWQLGLAHAISAERRLAPIAAVTFRYNLVFRHVERELLPFARAVGMGVMPYNPLGAGILTGFYSAGSPPPAGSRFTWGEYGRNSHKRYWTDENFRLLEELADVARQESMTPAQAAIAWLLSRDGVTAPIIGASTPAHLLESSVGLERKLSPEGTARLDEASQIFLRPNPDRERIKALKPDHSEREASSSSRLDTTSPT